MARVNMETMAWRRMNYLARLGAGARITKYDWQALLVANAKTERLRTMAREVRLLKRPKVKRSQNGSRRNRSGRLPRVNYRSNGRRWTRPRCVLVFMVAFSIDLRVADHGCC